jgi:hypothetical protein
MYDNEKYTRDYEHFEERHGDMRFGARANGE